MFIHVLKDRFVLIHPKQLSRHAGLHVVQTQCLTYATTDLTCKASQKTKGRQNNEFESGRKQPPNTLIADLGPYSQWYDQIPNALISNVKTIHRSQSPQCQACQSLNKLTCQSHTHSLRDLTNNIHVWPTILAVVLVGSVDQTVHTYHLV